ncbi:type II toxin-antitoxin system PemK/MazF family toxin [Cysteiniphilum halobium]|uniref:type II toxin-antitoxin system PemK/MazF family toxin n=1 Tax=Cysteiniphilum halobium TaxID=2219059 RepID=UPI000E64DA33|nr:type II toxin-antitoxin system PemK/MazF family toxin [Cysteiniphilum halobium]
MQTGEIWLANLNPSKGIEPGKMRPVLIVQNQVLIDVEHPSTIIIPLTTNLVDDASPLRIRVHRQDKLEKDSDLLIDQIRVIDNKRLIAGPLMQLPLEQLDVVYRALLEVMGMTGYQLQTH